MPPAATAPNVPLQPDDDFDERERAALEYSHLMQYAPEELDEELATLLARSGGGVLDWRAGTGEEPAR